MIVLMILIIEGAYRAIVLLLDASQFGVAGIAYGSSIENEHLIALDRVLVL